MFSHDPLSALIDMNDDVQSHKVQPVITREAADAFFKSVIIEEMSNPAIDLPEAAIDHFNCRDNINLVSRIYTYATNFLNRTYNTKSV